MEKTITRSFARNLTRQTSYKRHRSMRFQNYLPTIPAKIMIFPISVVLTI